MKSQHTLVDCCLLTENLSLTKKEDKKINFFFLIALYGARVRGSVFKMKFIVLSREF